MSPCTLSRIHITNMYYCRGIRPYQTVSLLSGSGRVGFSGPHRQKTNIFPDLFCSSLSDSDFSVHQPLSVRSLNEKEHDNHNGHDLAFNRHFLYQFIKVGEGNQTGNGCIFYSVSLYSSIVYVVYESAVLSF